ncbi:BZ3500_MvSof-1268-A1-R1_Chr6-3g08815 [Microbotryum saponariae]|uniref:BZ3500_MvSof-1268-A1-R1_Chr6-3g08815 protein n=1 Tax=Microbotryum saponariae TaxID=289078 RepID=A0A2X0NML0_9BASI|nr:BZ3500_MvSof-1268-A1-R1_Chr6-3g08815 [Microbotryum saponariae]SDA07416.1 BZ3501_MvSof-1269-A2-R1_Chr6-2g08518 [Microbotryum saponariae]
MPLHSPDESTPTFTSSPTTDEHLDQFLTIPSSSSTARGSAAPVRPLNSSGVPALGTLGRGVGVGDGGPRNGHRFYATHSDKPFARSAANRASVMTLPSIEYLQHQYVKLGIRDKTAAKATPLESVQQDPHASMDSHPIHMPGSESNRLLSSPRRVSPGPLKLIQQHGLSRLTEDDLPPSPARPEQEHKVPWEQGRSVKDERELRAEVQHRVKTVCQHWHISIPSSLNTLRSVRSAIGLPFETSNAAIDKHGSSESTNLVPLLLQSTTSAIRAVQRYVISLPSDSISPAAHSPECRSPVSPSKPTRPISARPRISVLTSATSPTATTNRSSGTTPPDPLSFLRHASLDLLGALHDLEIKYRVLPSSSPTEPIDQNGVKCGATTSSDNSASLSIPNSSSLSDLSIIDPDAVYEEVELVQLSKETELVKAWVNYVEELLSRLSKPSTASRRASVKLESALPTMGEAMEDEPPAWAIGEVDEENVLGERAYSFQERHLLIRRQSPSDRFYAVLETHLDAELLEPVHKSREPTNLLSSGSGVDDRGEWHRTLLDALSNGYLLLLAFNSIVRASDQPFGFVAPTSIHAFPTDSHATRKRRVSIDASGDSKSPSTGKLGDLYRRTENLQHWVGAIKFRYLIDLTKSGLDAKLIARKGGGWEVQLKRGLMEWVEAILCEMRTGDASRRGSEERG